MSVNAAALDAFVKPLQEAVAARRSSGVARAIYEVSRLFNLPEGRVKAAVYGEVRQVLAAEVLQIQRCLAVHLEREADRLDAQAAMLRARRDALRGDA